jgi:hypothetical protein
LNLRHDAFFSVFVGDGLSFEALFVCRSIYFKIKKYKTTIVNPTTAAMRLFRRALTTSSSCFGHTFLLIRVVLSQPSISHIDSVLLKRVNTMSRTTSTMKEMMNISSGISEIPEGIKPKSNVYNE